LEVEEGLIRFEEGLIAEVRHGRMMAARS